MALRDQPLWLQKILNDSEPPPRRYVWSLHNLDSKQKSTAFPSRRTSGQDGSEHRVFVLGLGNLGRLYASTLSQLSKPPPVTLVVHRRGLLEHWASMPDPGIEMTRYGQLERLSNFEIEWWTDEKPPIGPIEEVAGGGMIRNLIIATKATEAVPEVDRLRRYLDGSSTVLFVQNGMNKLWPPHGRVYAAHRYPDGTHPNYLHGITTHGVYSEGPFKSVHASPADVVIGPVEKHNDTGDYLTKLITTAPHLAGRVVPQSELWILQLQKLVVNMIINPLTAIMRIRNGQLFADQDGEATKVTDQLLTEASQVLQALIQHESSREILQDSDTSVETLLGRFSVASLRELVHRVSVMTKENRSSMYQDVLAGKQTEIREFNGWLVETAELLDSNVLGVTCHKLLIDLVEQGVELDKAELGRLLLPFPR